MPVEVAVGSAAGSAAAVPEATAPATGPEVAAVADPSFEAEEAAVEEQEKNEDVEPAGAADSGTEEAPDA